MREIKIKKKFKMKNEREKKLKVKKRDVKKGTSTKELAKYKQMTQKRLII